MTAPVIALTSAANSQKPTFDTDLYLPVEGNTVYLAISRDPTFGFYDQNVACVMTQSQIDNLAYSWAITTLFNGVNYFRVTFNGEVSNIEQDTISGSVDGPLYGDTFDTHDGLTNPKKKPEESQASLPEFPPSLETGSDEPAQPKELRKLPESIMKQLRLKPKTSQKREQNTRRRNEDDEIGFVMGMIH